MRVMRALMGLALLAGLAGCSAGPAPRASGPTPDPVEVADLAAGINAARAEAGVAPLARTAALDAAAAAHAADMAARGYFDHTTPEGRTVLQRIRAAGTYACYAAENIARGQSDGAAVVASWMGSDGHRRNMLSTSPKSFGVGAGPGRNWVAVFARRC